MANTRDIWYLLNDEKKYLYHYTSARTFVDYIWKNKTLKASKFSDVNDPWESKNWAFHWFTRKQSFSGELERARPLLERALKINWCVSCFTADPVEALMTRERENRGEDIMSAPFERGHSRPTMWAHYAANHSGVCVVFSRSAIIDAFENFTKQIKRKCYHRFVEYAKFTLRKNVFRVGAFSVDVDAMEGMGYEAYARRHVELYSKELFFTKNKDWSVEHEYRIIIENDGEDALFIPIDNAIVGVAIGEGCEIQDRIDIGRCIFDTEVSPCIMDWQMGAPQPKPTHARLLTDKDWSSV